MRTFEILILFALFVRLIGYSIPSIRRSRWIDYLPSVTMLLIGFHLIVEKFRWQMLPAYGLSLILFILSIHQLKNKENTDHKPSAHPIGVIIGFLWRLLVCILIVAPPVLIPVFRLPEPTGPYAIGTTRFHLVDHTRPETLTPDPDDVRELMIQIWYPAQVEAGARLAPLMEDMPFQFSHLSLVQTHAYLDTPVSDAQATYPALVFSHGHVGFIEQNLTQMEELASYGYIVCSIAHTYHTIATAFPDGRIIPAEETTANAYLQGIPLAPAVYADHLRIWTEDTLFVIDELERIQIGEIESLLTGKLDMSHLGIFGQSFGGVTAVQVCSVDERCQAGINMDAGLPRDYTGHVIATPLQQAFMFMANESQAYNMRIDLRVVENTAYGISIRGTKHFNFTDLLFYSPVLKFSDAFGSIDRDRMVEILNHYTVAFFDQQLKDKISPLLKGPAPDYPEVEFLSR